MNTHSDPRYPGVYFYGDVVIANQVTIFPGAHIGRPPMATGSIHQTPRTNLSTLICRGSIIGANAVLYQGVALGRDVLIGDGATIRENSVVDDNAIIGSNVTMQNNVYVGRRSRVLDLSHITAHVHIGDDVFISVSVMTMNDNSMAQGGELLPPKIMNGARIGGGALLLPGVVIGEGALIAAGSVVTKNVDANIRVQGIPAKRFGLPIPKTDEQIWDEAYFKDEARTVGSPDGVKPSAR